MNHHRLGMGVAEEPEDAVVTTVTLPSASFCSMSAPVASKWYEMLSTSSHWSTTAEAELLK